VDDYKQDYGYIGPALCAAVAKARTQPVALATTTTTTALTTNQQQGSNCTGKTLVQTGEQIVIDNSSMCIINNNYVVVTSSSPGQQTGRTIMLGTSRSASGTSATGGQKFVILQSRSQTPTASNINTSAIQQQQSQTQQQPQQQQPPQQVKLAQTNVSQQKAHVPSSTTKLVVVCMSASSHTNTSVTQV